MEKEKMEGRKKGWKGGKEERKEGKEEGRKERRKERNAPLFLVLSQLFFFVFFYLWGRRELRLSHFSLRGRLYSNHYFSSPVHLQRRSTPDGVRDLY
jgi:hypothetical protein